MNMTENFSKYEFQYLKHVDGLRALCVLGIFVYHLNPTWLPGGFLGVDIFFVISGYLITALFLRDMNIKSRLSFKKFYIRRFRRLFPSFLLVTVLSQLISYLIFENTTYRQISKSIVASLLGISNLFFFKTSDYFNLDSGSQPLLHFWSLNVEEQFYLLWPFLFLVFFKKFGRKSSYLFALSFILYLVTFAMNISHPVAVFYLPIFRFYLFIFGGWLAFLTIKVTMKIRFQLTLIWFSVILLIMCLYILNSGDLLPGLWTPALLIVTAFLIVFGKADSKFNPLNFKFLQFIGLRSYTIYLVHWPLIVFYKYRYSLEELPFFSAILIFGLGLIISSLIYKYYEIPIRYGKFSEQNVVKILSLASIPTLLAALLVLYPSSASPSASSASPSASSASPSASSASPSASSASPGASSASPSASSASPSASSAKEIFYSESVIEIGKNYRFGPLVKICEKKSWEQCYEPTKTSVNVMVIGDSHSVDALNALVNLYPEFDYSLASVPGCIIEKNFENLYPRTYPQFDDCVKLNNEKWFNPIFLKKFDFVAINILYGGKNEENLITYLEYLKESGVEKVIVFGGLFTFSQPLPELVNRYGFDQGKISEFVTDNSIRDMSIASLSKKLGYFFVSKRNVFCESRFCDYWSATKIPMTWDQHHMSLEFASDLLKRSKIDLDRYFGGTKSQDSR
jgi:peptidoglycan/LPS O-acetylase OafA/YrhL